MFKPYPYQRKEIDEAREWLRRGKKSVLIQSPAGSGKSVVIAEIARLCIEKGGRVLFMVHRQELVEQIRETFLADEIDLSKATIMTVGKIVRRLNKLDKPTLIITDETHHALAKTYLKVYEHYSDTPRIGFTATPWRLSGKGFKDVYDVMVKGPQVKWLIDNHFLAPATVYVPKIDTKMLKRGSTGDYTQQSMDDMSKHIIYSDVIDSWKKYAKGMQTIVYCHSIEFSKQVAQWFNDAGISARHADSKTPQGEREEIMHGFKNGDIKVLCNVDLISEGFNVPDCGCVVMLRPTKSLVLYIQQSMRCMRYKPGKRAVIIDQVGNVLEHGLPEQDREWSLEPRKKNKKKSGGDSGPGIKECPECYGYILQQCTTCPLCGHVFPKPKSKENYEYDAEAGLQVATAKLVLNYTGMKDPKDANSIEELKAIQKFRGYKKGWVWYQAKQRGWIKERKK